jgi:hypothetical protein
LVEHCEEHGNEAVLILALHKERPLNSEVKILTGRLQGFLQQRVVVRSKFDRNNFLYRSSYRNPNAYDDSQLESFLPRPPSYESDVGRLQRGLQRANAVCKVSFTDRATTGTGVLIAPDLVLTNYHVLSQQVIQDRSQLAEKTKNLIFEFGFVSKEHDTLVSPDTFAVEAMNPIVSCSPPTKLDYVLLQVEPRIRSFDYIKPVHIGSITRPLI